MDPVEFPSAVAAAGFLTFGLGMVTGFVLSVLARIFD